MFIVGEGSIAAKRLFQMTYDAMWKGIVKVKPGAHLGDIGHAIQTFAENNGFSVVREFCGHGIGQKFHEEPQVLHYGRPGTLEELVPGMMFTIEPMINAGRREIREMGDGWTIVTKDRSLSAQWEHTVLVTETGYEVMTLSAGSPPPPAFVDRRERAVARAAADRRPRVLRRAGANGAQSRLCAAVPRRQGRAARPLSRIAADRAGGVAPDPRADQACRPDPARACGTHAAMPPGAALLAVGGYGRGELFPHSDVDVLVLLPPTAGGQRRAEGVDRGLHHRLLGHRPGDRLERAHRRRVHRDGAQRRDGADRAARVALPVRLAARVRHVPQRQHRRRWTPKAFLRAKTLEMRQRHQKFEDTPYSLEPNCKESPGGLRDLQVVIWVARAAGLGKTWAELAAKGLITPFEVKQLQRNEGLLKLIRARLHMIAGRREDRLVFDLQTAVAESFGYRRRRAQRASEVLMRRYYWAAKAVTQLNQILMLNIEERVNGSQDAPMRPITEKFLERGGMLEVASDDLYQRDPHAILETFLVYQQTVGPKGLSARTLRALYNARDLMDAKFRRDPVNRATFMKILKEPEGPDARVPADEPDQRAGPLPVGVPAHRRADAARPVPRLHGRPAHPDGAAQRAALLHPRARARIPVLLAAGLDLRPALGALRRGAVPRRRQGPRRRPFRARRARRRGASAATTASTAKTRALIEFLVEERT